MRRAFRSACITTSTTGTTSSRPVMSNLFVSDVTHNYYVDILRELVAHGHIVKVLKTSKRPGYSPASLEPLVAALQPRVLIAEDFHFPERFEEICDPDFSVLSLEFFAEPGPSSSPHPCLVLSAALYYGSFFGAAVLPADRAFLQDHQVGRRRHGVLLCVSAWRLRDRALCLGEGDETEGTIR